MSTRAKVEEAIKAIEDKGSNKAKEVRDVLTLLLDYTENDSAGDNQNGLKTFHFFNDSNSVKLSNEQGNTVGKVWYSFKGIMGQSVNFTFKIETNSESVFKYVFLIPSELYGILKEITADNSSGLWFSVPILKSSYNPNPQFPSENMDDIEVGSMQFDLSTTNRVTLLFMSKFEEFGSINVYSSVQFHAPKFA